MPRPPQTWTEPQAGSIRTDWLPQMDRVEYCVCSDWPCTEETCRRHLGGCAACAKYGRALFTRAEVRWVDTDEGLPADVVQGLRNLWGRHDGHNSRLLRETGVKYGDGAKPPEPVAAAC